MTSVVYKFTANDSGVYDLPFGNVSVVLVAAQRPGDTFPTIWAEISEGSLPLAMGRVAACFGTGHPIPTSATGHLGSAVCAKGDLVLVWHVYELDK